MVHGTFSPARAWRPAVVARLARTLGPMLNANEVSLVGEWLFDAGKVIGALVCQRIEQLVANHLVERARSADGWSTLYQDPADGRLWEHTYLQGHLQGGGPPALTCVAPAYAHSRYAFPVKAPVALSQSTLQAIAPLIAPLQALGYFPASVEESASFGNFSVSFAGPEREFALTRDRGQFLVQGPATEVLESAGLWRAFHGVSSLASPLLSWLAPPNGA